MPPRLVVHVDVDVLTGERLSRYGRRRRAWATSTVLGTATMAASMLSPTQRLRIVLPRYGVDVVGGAESLMRRLALQLRDRGWQVTVLASCARDARTWRNELPAGRTVEEGITVERFPVERERHPARFHQASRVFWKLPASWRPERWWLRAQGPHAPGLLAALRQTDAVPTLFMPYLYSPTVYGLPLTAGPRVLVPAAHDELPLRLHHVGEAIAHADALWYSTLEEQQLVERVHPQAGARAHAVGTTGVNAPEAVQPQRFRERTGVHGDYLIYGGRTVEGKGAKELVEAGHRLHATGARASLVLMGEAGETVHAEPGIVPVGRLDDALRWDAIAGARAVVVPSYQESLSLLALEGWAVYRPALLNLGSPVLAGHLERGGGGLGYHGVDGLVEAAGRLLANEGLATSLGIAGHAYVEREYRWDAVVARLQQLLQQAASSRAA